MTRRLETVILPALLLALIALPIPLLADRLPDPLATHWTFWVSTVRVTASARGLRIAFGPFGVPSRRMPLERIERAEATEIEPLRWGGWGYRWAGPGRSSVIVRRGPGLVLDLRGGGRFAVTVDEPAPGAGLINDLRRRHAAG